MFCNCLPKSVTRAPRWGGGFQNLMDRFKAQHCSFIVVTAMALVQALSVFAVEPEDILAPTIGPVVILPHASLSETYDDNVFFLSDDQGKIDDFVTSLSPGVSLQYGQNLLDSNYIGFDYTLTQNWYAENSEISSDNHALTFAINYQKEGKYRFSGSDSIRFDNSFLSGRERSTVFDGGKRLINRHYFIDQYRLDYIFSPKTSLYSSIDHNSSDYAEEPHYYYTDVFGGRTPYALYDVSSWQGALGFGWQAFPKVKLIGGGFYGQTSVERNISQMPVRPDSDFGGFFIEADGDFGEKLTGRLRGGYQVRQFDRLADGVSSDSHGMPVFQVALEYQFTPKRKGTLSYTREGRVSVESPDRAYAADMISVDVTQEIGTQDNLFANGGISYELDDFETRDSRQYQWIRASTGLTYHFNRWSKAQATYSFGLFDSNKGNIDYTANRAMLSVSVGY